MVAVDSPLLHHPITSEYCELCLEDTMERFGRALFTALYRIKQDSVILTEREVVYVPDFDDN